MVRKPKVTDLHGFVNINKPPGLSSHDVVSAVRRILGCKVGHAGTLDPAATGVLPICLGKATRLAEYISRCPKQYCGEITFGIETDSFDAAGTVLSKQDSSHLTVEDVSAIMPKFYGEIWQTPPMISALKYQGQPLYKIAREGKTAPINPRLVEIYQIDVLEARFSQPHPKIVLDVCCGKGTYIRSIAHDLGALLGTGAHLSSLCRTRVGDFTLESAIDLEDLEKYATEQGKDWLILMAEGISHLPAVYAREEWLEKLTHGNSISCEEELPIVPVCRIHNSLNGKLIGVGNTKRLEETQTAMIELSIDKVLVGENEIL